MKKVVGSSSIRNEMDGSAAPKTRSASVGDYVKALWEVAGTEVASTKEIADRLSISSASVSNMFGRLREMGLAEYERYRGHRLPKRDAPRPCAWCDATA